MAISRSVSNFLFTFKNDDYPRGDELLVVRFRGSEEISSPFEYVVDLAVKKADQNPIDFDLMIGKTALLTIRTGPQEEERFVHGIVRSFEYVREGAKFYRYVAKLVPRIWTLSLGEDCRIFQGKNVRDIVDEVLDGAGLDRSQYRFDLTETYEPREYAVQYGESDLHFISRLLEDEGIFYFFEHSAEEHVLVIADHSGANTSVDGTANPYPIEFREPTGTVETTECIQAFRLAKAVSVEKVVLSDYNFRTPNLLLRKEKPQNTLSPEVYQYSAGYTPKVPPDDPTTLQDEESTAIATKRSDELNRRAERRLQALQVSRKTVDGKCNCFRLIPGFRFELQNHPQATNNAEYLITKVSNQGSQPQVVQEEKVGEAEQGMSESRFDGIPYNMDVPYRPPLVTDRVRMKGIQTAVVVGPAEERVYTDKHGRVKIKFHWDRLEDRDEDSSCWVRVSQSWTGRNPSLGYGSVHLPHIGQEVIVDFLEGDPDRPIVTGRVYNGENMPMEPLPNNKYKSGFRDDYGNEIIFDASEGFIRLFSPPNVAMNLGGNAEYFTKNNQHEYVLGNKFEGVLGTKGEVLIGNSIEVKGPLLWNATFGLDYGLAIGGKYQINLAYDITSNIGPIISTTKKDILTRSKKDHILAAGDQVCILGGSESSQGGDQTSIIGVYPEKIALSTGTHTHKVQSNHAIDPNGRVQGSLYDVTPDKRSIHWALWSSLVATLCTTLGTEVIQMDERLDQKVWPHAVGWPITVLGMVAAVPATIAAAVTAWNELKDEKIEPVAHQDPPASIELKQEGLVTIKANHRPAADELGKIELGIGPSGSQTSTLELKDKALTVVSNGSRIEIDANNGNITISSQGTPGGGQVQVTSKANLALKSVTGNITLEGTALRGKISGMQDFGNLVINP